MFINFLIFIFTVFIIYLLVSNETIIEGLKKKKAPKGFRKKNNKINKNKNKKAVATAEDEEGEEEGEGDGEGEEEGEGDEEPKTIKSLSKIIRKQQKQIDRLSIAAADSSPQTTSALTADDPYDGDLGI
jgi:hypothetical protein